MKNILSFFIIFILFSFIKLQKLTPTTYNSAKFPLKTNSYMDFIDMKVECPNRGVMKNFYLRKGNGYFWFEMQCYSSQTSNPDYGEAIIKQVNYQGRVKNQLHKYEGMTEQLNDYEINCDVDYGLRGFEISVSDDCFKTIVYCNALKATYTSKLTFQTSPKYSGSFNIDGFFDVLVGRTDQENDVDIGYPLRGFKFVVYPWRDRRDPTVCFMYGYSKLKNMAVVADAYKKKFEEIRNTNDQKN